MFQIIELSTLIFYIEFNSFVSVLLEVTNFWERDFVRRKPNYSIISTIDFNPKNFNIFAYVYRPIFLAMGLRIICVNVMSPAVPAWREVIQVTINLLLFVKNEPFSLISAWFFVMLCELYSVLSAGAINFPLIRASLDTHSSNHCPFLSIGICLGIVCFFSFNCILLYAQYNHTVQRKILKWYVHRK